MFAVRVTAVVFIVLMTVPPRAAVGDPTLRVLSLSDDLEQLALEQKIITHLKLELDNLNIETRDVSKTGFASASLHDKLKRVAKMSARQNVVATCWIETIDNQSILLHMVALETGRAFMRIIEADMGPRFAEELAFSAQELLGQTYMMAPPEKREVVKEVVSDVLDDADATSVKHKRLRVSIAPFAQITGANPGEWLQAGGGLWVELQIYRGLFFALSMAGMGLPLGDPSDGWVSGTAWVPGVDVGYTWWIDKVGVGLNFGVALGYYKLKMVIGQGDKREIGFLDPMVTAGLDLRFEMSRHLSVVLLPAAGFRFRTRDFKRVSDESVIVSTSTANWSLRSGLQIGF